MSSKSLGGTYKSGMFTCAMCNAVLGLFDRCDDIVSTFDVASDSLTVREIARIVVEEMKSKQLFLRFGVCTEDRRTWSELGTRASQVSTVMHKNINRLWFR